MKTNEERAKLIADQCKVNGCNTDFYDGIYQGVLLALKTEKSLLADGEKWRDLEDKISKFYDEESTEYHEGDICTIGEICATKLGFM
jgi:hypothetical protein